MTNSYPNLENAFISNTELKSILLEVYKDKTRYLTQLDELFYNLNLLGCEGIHEKIRDTNTNLNKFISIISELEIAKILAEKWNNVNLLADNYFEHKSPDILCENEKFNAFIEVMRLTESESEFKVIEFLRDYLRDLPYRVDAKLKNELSWPARDYQTRKKQTSLVNTSLSQFDESIKKANLTDFPFRIDTDGICFEINLTKFGKGYPGMINTEVIRIPEEILKQNIEYWLIEKAKKRNYLEKEYLDYPYVIAFDCEEWYIDDDTINELIYGQRTSIVALSKKHEQLKEKEWNLIINDKENKIPKWNEIEEARKKGWEKLLEKEALIPIDYTYLFKEGTFLSEPDMKNVSGVLFRRYKEVFYFPNPFASDKINYPGLIII